jgi:type I restriction enzyme S subunit
MPKKWADELPEFIVGPRELIMNLTAQSLKDEFLGRVCLTGPGEACLLNQRQARLTPVLVIPEFLLWLFKSPVFRRFVDGLNTGSLIQHMFTSQLADFVIPLPSLDEQHHIVAEIERRLSVIEELEAIVEANLTRANRLRQSILAYAFSGRLLGQDTKAKPGITQTFSMAAESQAKYGRGDRMGQ